MKKKVLIVGARGDRRLLAGGWALAQSVGHGPGGMGPVHAWTGLGHGSRHDAAHGQGWALG